MRRVLKSKRRNRVERAIERQLRYHQVDKARQSGPVAPARGRGKGPSALKELRKDRKGAWGMPVALGGEEGRDKLRKAAVRGKCPVTRGCPNGETRWKRFHHTAVMAVGEPGELKHLSTRRKRK